MADHDGGYKTLFANKRMVEDLLRGFVDEPWVDGLDFTTLEPCDGSYVTKDLDRYEQDMVWRVRWRNLEEGEAIHLAGSWLYVYVLLEFQSRIDKVMALRMLNYLCLLYLDLVKQGDLTASGKLPPVLPIVLYNGPQRWSAPREVGMLIEELPGGLSAYRPSLRYLLLDEGELTQAEPAQPGNLAAALFRLEHSRDVGEVGGIVERLAERLNPEEDRDLRRAFGTWLIQVLSEARFPEADQTLGEQLEESRDMLKDRVREWTEEWKQEGLQEGRREGRREVLLRLLEHRFGTPNATTRRRIEQAEDEELLAWSEKLLTADRLEDVFH